MSTKKKVTKKRVYRKPRNKYSAILYSTTKKPKGGVAYQYFWVYALMGDQLKQNTRFKAIYIRIEIHECNYRDVLMRAKPRKGETILNGIPV